MSRAGRTALGVVLLLTAGPAAAQRTVPDAGLRSATLSFDGQATLGDFTGTTTTATGALTGGADVRDVRGWVESPVATLKTGNGLRDKDMGKAMEIETYPVMRFDLLSVSLQHEAGDSAVVSLSGTFKIHGVTRDVSIPATVHFTPAGIRVQGRFPLNVRDYGVTRLSKMLGAFKMNPNITVHLDLVFAAAGAAPPPAAVPGETPPPTG